jgi:hypothetical protein
MPVIRISQKTWERLKSHASPLEHTANDVVSLALDALDAAQKRRGIKTFSHTKLKKRSERTDQKNIRRYSQKEFRILLL